MRSRSYIDIVGEILDAANERRGVGKNRLMFKAFLSHSQFKEYMKLLTKNGLLRSDIGTQTYKTTEKGVRFLEAYNRIYDVIEVTPKREQEQQQQQEQLTIQTVGF
jgi:predicted transcriptional regulator